MCYNVLCLLSRYWTGVPVVGGSAYVMQDSVVNERINLVYLNPHLTCNLCHGYLIDAVSITECLHPCSLWRSHISLVCKSCIVKYLASNNTCPVCNVIIHQSHPLNYIRWVVGLNFISYVVPTEHCRTSFIKSYLTWKRVSPVCANLRSWKKK